MELTEDQKMIQKMAREFVQKEVAPIAAEIDQTCQFPMENIRKLGELGFLGIPVPEKYGGTGLDYFSYALVIEELAKGCASTAVTVATHTSNSAGPIFLFGTEEQKEKYLVPMSKGEKLGAVALTEPGAGSDLKGISTRAVRQSDHYLLNGSKNFSTNGGVADVIVITAVTESEKEHPNRVALSTFILEKEMEGFQVGKAEDKMGWRASDTRSLVFENVKVPKENLLGQEGRGFEQTLAGLDHGRISIAALSLGIAETAYEAALQYSSERRQFGEPINRFQAIRFMLANMATEIECGRHLVYEAARLKDQGKPFRKEASMAKLYNSELAMRVTTKAVQIFGGYGYIKDYPVERYMRDAKVCEIGEGTSEIQRIVIANEIIKNSE